MNASVPFRSGAALQGEGSGERIGKESVLDRSVIDFSFFDKLVLDLSLFNCVGFSDVGLSVVGFSNNGATYSVQLIDNYPAYLAFAYLAKELLKLGPVGILAGITLVFENPATAAFQLILAEINLALNADTVLAVYGLSCINYIFSDIHVGLLSCGMELPTYKYIIPLIAPKANVVDAQAGVSLV